MSIFHHHDIAPLLGRESDPLVASKNPDMDAPMLDLRGPVPDLRAHLLHHRAFLVRLGGEYPDLRFLAECADLVKDLWLGGAKIADPSALATMVALKNLVDPPPAALPLLGRLPRLRRLILGGEHELSALDGCTTLCELYLTGAGRHDLARLPPLDQLELLHTSDASAEALVGIDQFSRLRTLLFAGTPTDGPTLAFLESRFGVTAAELAELKHHPRASDTYLAPRGFVRLDVDRRPALSVPPVSAPYQTEVTADQPGCVVLLIDRSASTARPFGYDFRVIVDPAAPEGAITTRHGFGPDGEMFIADGITDAVNRWLHALVQRCIVGDVVRHDVQVAIIEYGARVAPAWGGALNGRTLVPIAEIARHPLAIAGGVPVWITSESDGDTPLGEAMELARSIVEEWARTHPASHPPVVINLSAAGATGDDRDRHGWALKAVSIRAGNTLLFSVVREGSYGAPLFLIEGNSQAEREAEFRMASPLPPSIEERVRDAGYILVGPSRGCLWYAAAADFENLLHLFTALPGLPWRDNLIRHPLPPFDPPAWAREQPKVTAGRSDRPAWRAPKIRGPMSEALFWRLIDVSRRGTLDVSEQRDRLVLLLARLPESDLIEFDRILEARMTDAYLWDLWAVAYIAMNGCSDDGFDYFCAWLVAQGQSYFEAALHDPVKAAKRIKPGDVAEFEELMSVASSAYEKQTGKESDWKGREVQATRGVPRGDQWDEDDLPRRFPKLVKKYVQH